MIQILLLTIVFTGLFIFPKHAKAQDTIAKTSLTTTETTISNQTVNNRFSAKQLLVGIDAGALMIAKFRSVPLTFRYGISDKAIGVLSIGYVDFRNDSAGKRGSNYRSAGAYISVGADYVLTKNRNFKGIWCAGASIVFSKTTESLNYTFKGNSFPDYVGKINRDLNVFGLEMRIGYLYPFTRKIYLHTGFRCVFVDANRDNFRDLPVRYAPGIGSNILMSHNFIPTFELKLYYKLF